MTRKNKTLNWMGIPARIHSVRDAVEYFDDSPVLHNGSIAQATERRSADTRFRHAPIESILSGDRKGPLNYKGTLTDTTAFSKRARSLPVDHFRKLGPKDKLADSIAMRLKRDLQQELLMPEQEAAALVGNLYHESGDFGALYGDLEERNKDPNKGLGYAQWTGDRRKRFLDWSEARGLDPNSYEANYGFLKQEIVGPKPESDFREPLSRASDLDTATRVVAKDYLRPKKGLEHYGNRKRLAARVMQFPNYARQAPIPAPRPDDEVEPWKY
ncbi:phage tail tip lysozyme [Sinorhizobium chiapasense]|uniref:Phage tail tip lysozyme n=1 Tax=Sinorhizobium chiapasense TaxID=501572 RepID=A0ABZ2BDL4_9HYPH